MVVIIINNSNNNKKRIKQHAFAFWKEYQYKMWLYNTVTIMDGKGEFRLDFLRHCVVISQGDFQGKSKSLLL